MNLKVDDERLIHRDLGQYTGIYVRAQNSAGTWSAFDIATLDRDSLLEWLRSRGPNSAWCENVVLQLLGHEQQRDSASGAK